MDHASLWSWELVEGVVKFAPFDTGRGNGQTLIISCHVTFTGRASGADDRSTSAGRTWCAGDAGSGTAVDLFVDRTQVLRWLKKMTGYFAYLRHLKNYDFELEKYVLHKNTTCCWKLVKKIWILNFMLLCSVTAVQPQNTIGQTMGILIVNKDTDFTMPLTL